MVARMLALHQRTPGHDAGRRPTLVHLRLSQRSAEVAQGLASLKIPAMLHPSSDGAKPVIHPVPRGQ